MKWQARGLTAEEKAEFEDDVWPEKEALFTDRGVVWGRGKGECKKNCVKSTERKMWQWVEKICPEYDDAAECIGAKREWG